ncbi:unnamed protein product [Urochloa humidicola]
MDGSRQFNQWPLGTLQHKQPAPAVNEGSGRANLPTRHPLPEASPYAADELVQEPVTGTNGLGSCDTTNDGSSGHISAPSAMDCDVVSPRSRNSARNLLTNMPVSWNFSVAASTSAEPAGDGTLDTATTSTRGSLHAQHGHIMAERKRREKINKLFIELSAVIPGLKKMDKATILADAARHVKELQEKVNAAMEAGSSDDVIRSTGPAFLIEKTCHAAADQEEGCRCPLGVPAAATRQAPEIDAWLSGNNVMIRILCEDGKGVVVRVLTEVEELHLRIVDVNVIPFPASTRIIITITAKVEAGFITAEKVIGRLATACTWCSCKRMS